METAFNAICLFLIYGGFLVPVGLVVWAYFSVCYLMNRWDERRFRH